MVQEPSDKRHRGETSDKSSNLDDVHVPGEKREYTRTLTGVELPGKEKLEADLARLTQDISMLKDNREKALYNLAEMQTTISDKTKLLTRPTSPFMI